MAKKFTCVNEFGVDCSPVNAVEIQIETDHFTIVVDSKKSTMYIGDDVVDTTQVTQNRFEQVRDYVQVSLNREREQEELNKIMGN